MATQIHRPSRDEFAAAVEVLKLLADPTRLQALHVLIGGERSVNDLADELDVPAAALSQHLAKLRLGRLVTTRREGNRIHYALVNEHVERLVAEALFEADHLIGGAAHHARTAIA
jgi:DNA-binding transcriptional ArsR family regulator